MRRRMLFLSGVAAGMLLLATLAAGQATTPAFELVRTIGAPPPQGVVYDPQFEQFVMPDSDGRLLLLDATTFTTRHVLYESGSYNAYTFSHDGRWLAVAIDSQIDVWETQTGELSVTLDMAVIRVTGPLLFSDDDTLLLYNTVVPAPDDIRIFETDTSNVPWLWDIAAERRDRTSILPEQVIAQPFYELRNGFILGPNNRIAVAHPGFIDLRAIRPTGFPSVTTIETARYERDPMDLWFSLRGDSIYFRALDQVSMFQIDTATDTVLNLPTGRDLSAARMEPFRALALSDTAAIVGDANTRRSNSFLRLLLGDDYHAQYNNHPLTVMVLDVLEPVTVSDDQRAFLIYLLDEQTGYGVLDVIRPIDILDMALHPNGHQVAVRRASGQQPVELYDLRTGNLDLSFVPALPDDGQQLLAYNGAGSVLLVGWQRFDARTGELLAQDVRYRPGFDQFAFSDDSQSLLTFDEPGYVQWNIETGAIMRQETTRYRGPLLDSSPDGLRTLSQTGSGVEVLDAGTGERLSVTFQTLPGRDIQNVIPSPDWEHYLIVYSADPYGPYSPGNEVAVYSLREGQKWFLAGDDLPDPSQRSYGWLDNRTAYVTGGVDSGAQPERIYGLDYAPSGLPACLVETFPETWTQWTPLWEELNARLRSDALGRLTQRLCSATLLSEQTIENIVSPTPTPARPRLTPTPALIAGVPSCLSAQYRDEALQYAQEWRRLTDGLAPEAILELQDILCKGLEDGIHRSAPSLPGLSQGPTSAVMTIDVETGQRAIGGVLPERAPSVNALTVILNEFERTQGFMPFDVALSPNREFLALRTPTGHVAIYRLLRSYDDLTASIRATEQARQAAQPDTLSLAPTPTAPFETIGQPRPTLTPTVTPTPPPAATEPAIQAQGAQTQEMCADPILHHVSAPPAGYAPSGRILAAHRGSGVVWVYDPATGIGRPDETLVDPQVGELSPNQHWLLFRGERITVSRPDGSDLVVLFEAEEQSQFPGHIYWRDSDTLEYVYEGFAPDLSATEITLIRAYHVPSRTLSAPFMVEGQPRVNNLDTQVVAAQPARGPLALVSTSFNTGMGIGYKYYIYDRETGVADYFARLTDSITLQAEWHPLGRWLYYRYPGEDEWRVFDARTRQHRFLGDLPDGVWSRDARLRAAWITLPHDELVERMEHDLPLPRLRIWDSETGLTRLYCIPQSGTEYLEASLFWSPDNRYLLFQIVLPDDATQELYYPRTLVLDLDTGSVTELTFDISRVMVWTD